MDGVNKYLDIEKKLPKLPEVLLNTIQSEFLEISKLDKSCVKFINSSNKIPKLKDAYYVVYSPYVKKSDHKYEKFIFLAEDGEELFDVDGRDLELYGLLSCVNIDFSQEYKDGLEHGE